LPDENKLYTCRTTFYGLKKPKSVVLQLILLKKKFWEPKKCGKKIFEQKMFGNKFGGSNDFRAKIGYKFVVRRSIIVSTIEKIVIF